MGKNNKFLDFTLYLFMFRYHLRPQIIFNKYNVSNPRPILAKPLLIKVASRHNVLEPNLSCPKELKSDTLFVNCMKSSEGGTITHLNVKTGEYLIMKCGKELLETKNRMIISIHYSQFHPDSYILSMLLHLTEQ